MKEEMMAIIIALATAAAIIAFLFFSHLNWMTQRKYRPSKYEIEEKLQRVLSGTMEWQEWDDFICVPIRYDQNLDIIRLKCFKLKGDEYYRRENAEEQKKWIFNQEGLKKISDIILELKNTKIE